VNNILVTAVAWLAVIARDRSRREIAMPVTIPHDPHALRGRHHRARAL